MSRLLNAKFFGQENILPLFFRDSVSTNNLYFALMIWSYPPPLQHVVVPEFLRIAEKRSSFGDKRELVDLFVAGFSCLLEKYCVWFSLALSDEK